MIHTPDTDSLGVLAHKWTILRRGRFWLFAAMMLLAGGAEGAFTFWTASYVQLHFDGLPRHGGIGTALFAGGMIAGRFAFGFLVGQKRLRRLILLSAVAGTAVATGVLFTTALPLLYALLLLAGLSIACFWPTIQSYSADRLPVDSTVLFILLSCAGIPGFAGVSWLMGIIGDRHDLHRAFAIVPVCLIGLALLVLIERSLPKRPAALASEPVP
jgi:fucose permease